MLGKAVTRSSENLENQVFLNPDIVCHDFIAFATDL
jgi:hypothetical protein